MMIAIIIIGFLHKEAWLEMIKAGGSYSVAFSILLMAACAFSLSFRLPSPPE